MESRRRIYSLKYIIGTYVVLSIFVLLNIGVKDKENFSGIIEATCIFVELGMLAIFIIVDRSRIVFKECIQLIVIILAIAVFWCSAISSPNTIKRNYVLIIIGSIIIMFFLAALILIVMKKERKLNLNIKKILFRCGIYFAFFLGNIPLLNTQLNNDGYEYYRYIRNVSNWDFSGIYQFKLAGHVSAGYSCFLLVGEFLFPNNVIGVRLVHIIMALITIYAFEKIIDVLKLPKCARIFMVVAFAFSPVLFGTCSEINLDFGLFCFFIWFVSCYINKCYILQKVCGLLLCFTKEPGCVLFGMFVMGEIIEIYISAKGSLKDKLKKIMRSTVIFEISIGIIWFALFIVNGRSYWTSLMGGSEIQDGGIKLNSFTINIDYIIYKIREILFINWGWVFVITSVTMLIYNLLKNKNISLDRFLIPLSLSVIFYWVFNFIYFTWPHYRYVNVSYFYLLLFFLCTIHTCIKSKIIINRLTLGIGILVILSSYFTFDSLVEKNFIVYKTAVGKIAVVGTLDKNSSGDYLVNHGNLSVTTLDNSGCYNSQNAYFKRNLNKSFAEIIYDSDILVLIPFQMRDSFGTLASIFGSFPQRTNKLYWDTYKSRLEIELAEYLEENERYKKINILCIDSIENIDKQVLDEYNEIYYFAIELDSSIKSNEILSLEKNNFPVISRVRTIGWEWEIYQIKKNEV